MLWAEDPSMQLQPVHDPGTPRRLAFVAIGALTCGLVALAWFGGDPFRTPVVPASAVRTSGEPSDRRAVTAQASTGGAGPCLGSTADLGSPVRFTAPQAGTDIRGGTAVRVAGQGAPVGIVVQLTTADGQTISAPTDQRGAFAAEVTFVSPTQPQSATIRAAAAGIDQRGASYCGAPLGAVAFTVLPGADVSVWEPAQADLSGPPFSVSGATAGAIPTVRVRLEAPDGSLIDEVTVPTFKVADGDHAFRSPPLAVERSDLGPAVLILIWTDPRTGVQAPELVRRVRLTAAAADP